MGLHLGVEIDNELFSDCRCMNELINGLADNRKRFIIPEAICFRYGFNKEWSSSGSTLYRLFLIAYGFILNIPSDRNIIGITQDDADREVEMDSDEELSP